MYHKPTQDRYNATEKGKARKRKWQQNMSPEQKEKQRLAKLAYMRRKRAEQKLQRQEQEQPKQEGTQE